MPNYALIRGNRVVNVAVVDDATDDGKVYLALVASDYDQVKPMENVAVGQCLDNNGSPIPLPNLTTDRASIPADGKTAATVTYTNTQPDAPTSVDFDVNGSTSTVDLVAGEAEVAVTSSTAGDTVEVQAAGLVVNIEVES